jgi:opacity protein-like surface antigen
MEILFMGENRMLKHKIVVLAVLTLTAMVAAYAADVTGKWTAEFDTAIGVQKYTYEFKVDGTKLTGKAIGKRSDSEAEVEIQEGKINGDEISFVENLKFGDQDLRIEYKGKLSGDEIKFTRKVGDFAAEEFVAKRAK